MESHPKAQETISSSSSNYGCTNGTTPAAAPPSSSSPPAPPPLTRKSVPRDGEVNPYPTTFVQADTSSFKQVVQMLTGSAETVAAAAAAAANSTVRKAPVAPATKATGPKKPAFKLYERRNSLKNLKILSPLIPTFFNSNPSTPVTAAGFSPRKQPEILSPSILDFPSLVLSPITPLIPDPFNRSPHPNSEAAKWAEDRAIAEKGFYLHPSPRASAEADPPRLLPLFPVTSPEVSSDLSLAMPRSSTRAV
ncbi:hypothetical protein OPV22_013398 [Ensete ventricosum]|uniref:VQ domain-containing protein n=1 Tax=Ensete ventricosum TaxID=4639 RepID=A0AAV8QVG5_ENSVE|nr:hypothetical protein OPV22_013398 [Ensete ventricosum]